MSSYCATCGRQRTGTERFCDGCRAEFTDARDGQEAATSDQPHPGPPADATRADPVFGAARRDQPAAEPDPFAGWYQPQRPGGAQGSAPANADGTWQPTQTVYSPPTRPTGFPPPPQAPNNPPYPPYQPVPPAAGPSGRGRGLFIALAAIVVLAAGGGAYALANSLGNHAAQSPTQPSTGSTTPASGTTPAGGTTPASGGSSSAGSPKQAGSQTASPALSLVTIGPGVTSSAAEPQVETLLSHYFHGINTRDYAEYASTLNPAQQAKQSQSTFESGYSTTSDSGMTLTSLASDGSAGLVATVTFTSHQSPAQSVDHSACNAWTLNFYLVPRGTGYLIGPAPSGYQPTHSDC
jgi:hypothetical protein